MIIAICWPSMKIEFVSSPSRIAYLQILMVTFLLSSCSLNGVEAGNSEPMVFPKDSAPYGMGYDQWSAKWWEWFLSIPAETHPVDDSDGRYCSKNQSGPVWYLTGSNGERQFRNCTIPVGKAILFPILTTECSYAENTDLKTPQDLRNCAVEEHEKYISRSQDLKVDGKQINVDEFRVQSPLFNFTFPQNNLFGAPPGPTQGLSDGWFIILKPLSPGNHIIEISGEISKPPPGGFSTAATYNLDVK
jgi:hypothetical protein